MVEEVDLVEVVALELVVVLVVAVVLDLVAELVVATRLNVDMNMVSTSHYIQIVLLPSVSVKKTVN